MSDLFSLFAMGGTYGKQASAFFGEYNAKVEGNSSTWNILLTVLYVKSMLTTLLFINYAMRLEKETKPKC